MKKGRLSWLLTVVLFLAVGCNAGESKKSTTDDTTIINDTAGMPVITPGTSDSGAIITTPPVNDNNVVLPDSAIIQKR